MGNPFVHIELQTRDLAKAKDFYSRLFDWKLEDLPAPSGGMFSNTDSNFAGCDGNRRPRLAQRDHGPYRGVIGMWKPEEAA